MHNRSFAVLAGFLSLILAMGCHQNKPPDIRPVDPTVPPSATPPPATSPPPTSTPKPEKTATPDPPTQTPPSEPSPTQTLPPFQITKDISYIPEGNSKQKLDLYLPSGSETPLPTLLVIHEGGGHKEQMAFWARHFAERGYAVISINHREWPDYGYPDHIQDAFCSLAWVFNNAAIYGFDPKNVFAMGHSSGGTMAAMLGVVDDASIYLEDCPHNLPEGAGVRGVIPFTGIFDYLSLVDSPGNLEDYAVGLLGGTIDEILDTWNEASAITWIDGSEPPFLILHGGNDNNITPNQSKDFAQALEDAGVEVELMIVPNADHYQITKSEESMAAVEDFLSQLLER